MGNETPSYRTIGNFINDYIVPSRDKFFSLITKEIFRTCNLKMDKAFVDGSKFEADANKYKFVWKPTTFHNKLSDKIRIILEKYDLLGYRYKTLLEGDDSVFSDETKMEKILITQYEKSIHEIDDLI